ncbi:hypothetical protein BC830DRAFT_1216883 [Chytriomyces sp. MP71]|nr:hypothetical protein BC830DRAFT_1216883 [Chytriomyces sp. MP71]
MTIEQIKYAAAESVSPGQAALKRQPLKRNFSLDKKYRHWKVEPHIGTEFAEGIQIRDILSAEDADDLLQDLAVLISERNVAFFRDQDLTIEEQKEFADRLGNAAGKPSTSGLHIHPTTALTSEFGDEVLAISSEYDLSTVRSLNQSEISNFGWHSDVTFEPNPSDYAVLRLRQVPESGGDTVFASAYEVYERLSPAFQRFLEDLTATHTGDGFLGLAAEGLTKIVPGPRGAPDNVGTHLTTVHPVVRTNPVTGWKGVFVNNIFTKRINELSKDESDWVLKHLANLTIQNHDLQVRFKWNKHDVAVWDNRSTYHTATRDYDVATELRVGDRTTSVGESPYLDPASTSRREALQIRPPVPRRAHLASLIKIV